MYHVLYIDELFSYGLWPPIYSYGPCDLYRHAEAKEAGLVEYPLLGDRDT